MVVTDSEIADFHRGLTDYGYADVETAIEKFKEVKLYASDLAEQVREFAESTGTAIADIDVCYVAWDYILQMARNKIGEILGFDICNDIKGGTEFYTYGNFMCTSYDWSDDVKEQLEEKLSNADSEEITVLTEDIFVRVFLQDVEIDIKETQTESLEVAN